MKEGVSFPHKHHCGTCIPGYWNFYPILSTDNVIILVQYYSSFLLVFQALSFRCWGEPKRFFFFFFKSVASTREKDSNYQTVWKWECWYGYVYFQLFMSLIDIVISEVIFVFNAYHYTLDIYTNWFVSFDTPCIVVK